MRLTFRILVAFTAFALGIAVVSTVAYFIDRNYPLPNIDPAQDNQNKPVPVPLPVTNDWPPHRPRIPNARLGFSGDGWHNEGPATKGYEKWVGFYQNGKSFELKQVFVKVSRYYDEMYDDPGQQSGRRYSVQGSPKPVFMFKGIAGIGQGQVDTIFISDKKDFWGMSLPINETESPKFNLAGKEYCLRAKEKQSGRWKNSEYSKVVISGGHTSQVIYDPAFEEEFGAYEYYEVSWVGDLDHDNKLDLILLLSAQGEATYTKKMVLYLSSYAEPGELVAPVASFDDGGGC